MRRVIVESPYAGDVELNLRYLRACMADCLARGEAPFASHGLYTQPGVLRDEDPKEREWGIQAGFIWRLVADATVVYTDLGTSRGMEYGLEAARRLRADVGDVHAVEFRQLGEHWDASFRSDSPLSERATARWGNGLASSDLLHIRLRAGLHQAIAEIEAHKRDVEHWTSQPLVDELKALVSP